MKRTKFVFCILFLYFFNFNLANAKDEQPAWVNNSDIGCSAEEICANGTGTSSSLAKAEARNNILRYFETNIKSNFSSSINSNEEDIVRSFNSDDIEELSEGILKGVKIKYNYKDEDGFYSYAVLDKNIAIKEVDNDLNELDSKMKLLISENNIKYAKQLEKLYAKRTELNKRYLVLTGNLKPEIIRYEDIFKIKKIKSENNLIFYVNEVLNDNEKDVSDYISNNLLDNGATITLKREDANRILTITLRRTELYLKVDGFIKQKYSLKIESVDSFGKTKTSLYKEFIETGRDKEQTKEQADVEIKDYVLDNIGSLLQ